MTGSGDTVDSRNLEGRVLFVYPPGSDRVLYVSALSEASFEIAAAPTVTDATTRLTNVEPLDVIVMELGRVC